MLTKRIVACLDIAGGRIVKGVRFNNLRDSGDPAAAARKYCTDGIDELVVLDVSATRESREASLDAAARVAAVIDVPLTAGGGIRNLDDVGRYLAAGADKVAINSAALADPGLLGRCSQRFGSQCIVLSIDAIWMDTRYEVASHGGTKMHARDALGWAIEGVAAGAGEVLLTSIDRDGTRTGFDLAAISALAGALRVPLVASGGACDAASFGDALCAGADAALGASVFHDGTCNVADVKRHCTARGLEIRP
jgi:imidazole glycerol-phosphate synthase subunit HisF